MSHILENKIVIGTAQFGYDYGISNINGRVSSREVMNILHYSYENGINTIDTSKLYGISEKVIGNYILKHPNVFSNKESIKSHCDKKGYDDVWIIGGGKVYEEFMDEVDEIYVTRVWNSYVCDVFFPEISFDFALKYRSDVMVESDITYINEIYERSQIK